MGIGPDLPPHLAQQLGRSAARSPSPPPPRSGAQAGPQLPPGATIGPSVPSTSTAALPAADSDSDDDFGPSLPPDLAQARKVAGPARPTSLGPTLPPRNVAASAPKRETPLSAAYSDDDDDFGPMPLPAGVSYGHDDMNEGARLFKEREEREKEKERLEREGKGKMKREEWMLVPPKEMDLMASMDPTKLKSRSFASSTKTAEKAGASSGVNLWTETPQERQQRLEDEMMGRKRKAVVGAGGGGGPELEDESDEKRRKRERDQRLKDEVERHNRTSRNASLLDQHAALGSTKKVKPGEKEMPGIWDRDRDMGVGGRLMDDEKRADIVRNAKDLGGRFGGGSYL